MEGRGEQAARVETALRLAVRDVLLDHKRTGDPIVVWRDGCVVCIRAEEIVIEDLPATHGAAREQDSTG